MFVGHLAVALGASRLSPRTPLPWFLLAANLVDLIWPLMLLAGIEQVRVLPGAMAFTPLVFVSYPWTHSLLMGVAWGLALAGIARARGVTRETALILSAVVVSHWVLDFITHAPDLTLWPGRAGGYGLRLWDSAPATYAVEGALWFGAIALFLRGRAPRGANGRSAFWSFVLVSTVLWAVGPFSPPPPDERALAYFALIPWVIVPWGGWIQRTSDERR